MNVYVLVEGARTEKAIYKAWLSHCLPSVQPVARLEDLQGNGLFILSGKGYPSYRDHLKRSLEDIAAHGAIDWFLVCVDSEEMSLEEKRAELHSLLSEGPPFAQTRLIIQCCCIETWLLAHAKVFKRNPQDQKLRTYIEHHDVSRDDPEHMPGHPEWSTRAQFHADYLKRIFRERCLDYTKERPGIVCELDYLQMLVKRHTQTRHIASMGILVSTLKEMGASDETLGLGR